MEEQEMPSAAAAPATTADQTATASATPLETARDHEQPNPAPSIPPPSDIPEPSEKQHKDEPTQSEPSSLSDSATPITAQEAASLTSQPEPSQYPMQTPQQPTATPAKGGPESGRGSRSSKRVSFPIVGEDTPATATDATPSSAPRGRPPGRPRGSRARGPTRASTRGSRGGKRKRADDDDDDDGLSSDSEIYAPTTTKSGRNVQKPTSFVPPPQPSPPSVPTYKKKRTYRRNPESAVCKICLRGVSPASNMIVFCDGCNVPYHRYCHQPPIDQSVIDELDKEWYCKQCTRAMIRPVPEPHITNFVSAEGASAEERQKYFSTLPPGLLVTLLTKATTLQPSLPLFDPSFRPNPNANPTNTPAKPPAANGHSHPQPILRDMNDSDNDGEYPSDEHPAHYPRPGQGLMSTLGPEKDDLHYLVDEENSRGVFTHVYREDGEVVGAGAEAGAER